MRSLRARLFLGLACAIFVTGLAAGIFAFRWAFDEAIEMQDAVLLQVGSLAMRLHGPLELPAENGVDKEARVTIEQIGKSSGEAQTAWPQDLPEGLQTRTRAATTWRVLVRTRSDGSRVAIGQPTSSRDEVAHDSAIRAVAPLALLVPILLLLVGLIITFSFRAVSDLAAALDAKPAGDLDPLPLGGLPEELVPFIKSTNRLLARIALTLNQQRRFIASAAHEMRTPVTALSLQAENLARPDLPADIATRLSLLKDGIRRVARLLEQLLAASKYEAEESKPVAITAFDSVVKAVVADHLKLAEERSIDLGFEMIDNVFVCADPTSLSVLVRNVIDNALRHTPNGGRIDIKIIRKACVAQFSIEDTGPGLPEPDLDRVFEPFYRGSQSNGDGTGLGLSIVRSIVQRAGGSICLENVKAEHKSGLRVTVTFPQA